MLRALKRLICRVFGHNNTAVFDPNDDRVYVECKRCGYRQDRFFAVNDKGQLVVKSYSQEVKITKLRRSIERFRKDFPCFAR